MGNAGFISSAVVLLIIQAPTLPVSWPPSRRGSSSEGRPHRGAVEGFGVLGSRICSLSC